jgi:hypothetical protein
MPWRNIANQPLVKSELSGQMVSTWSEAWRHECEITYLLAMPLATRNIFLDGVQGGIVPARPKHSIDLTCRFRGRV